MLPTKFSKFQMCTSHSIMAFSAVLATDSHCRLNLHMLPNTQPLLIVFVWIRRASIGSCICLVIRDWHYLRIKRCDLMGVGVTLVEGVSLREDFEVSKSLGIFTVSCMLSSSPSSPPISAADEKRSSQLLFQPAMP